MGGPAGEQIEHPALLQPLKAGQQIAARLDPGLFGPLELEAEVGSRSAMVRWRLAQQLLAHLQPGEKALAEERVAQQGEERWRETHGQSRPLRGVRGGGLQGVQQRQVALQEGLEVPVLLQGAGCAGVHVRQVRVENQR